MEFDDITGSWEAGYSQGVTGSGNCTGLKVTTWTNTTVVYTISLVVIPRIPRWIRAIPWRSNSREHSCSSRCLRRPFHGRPKCRQVGNDVNLIWNNGGGPSFGPPPSFSRQAVFQGSALTECSRISRRPSSRPPMMRRKGAFHVGLKPRRLPVLREPHQEP